MGAGRQALCQCVAFHCAHTVAALPLTAAIEVKKAIHKWLGAQLDRGFLCCNGNRGRNGSRGAEGIAAGAFALHSKMLYRKPTMPQMEGGSCWFGCKCMRCMPPIPSTDLLSCVPHAPAHSAPCTMHHKPTHLIKDWWHHATVPPIKRAREGVDRLRRRARWRAHG